MGNIFLFRILTQLGRIEDGEILVLLMMSKVLYSKSLQYFLQSIFHFSLYILVQGNWDPDKIPRDKWTSLVFMVYDVVVTELADIYGVKFFVDLSGASRKVAKAWGDGEFIKKVQSVLQVILKEISIESIIDKYHI